MELKVCPVNENETKQAEHTKADVLVVEKMSTRSALPVAAVSRVRKPANGSPECFFCTGRDKVIDLSQRHHEGIPRTL